MLKVKLAALFVGILLTVASSAWSYAIKAEDVRVNPAAFSSNLSATDTDVQKALETLDAMVSSGGSTLDSGWTIGTGKTTTTRNVGIGTTVPGSALEVAGTVNAINFVGSAAGLTNLPDGMIYPGAGIPLSTGSIWGASITDNSGNWNTAYSDRLKWDGGATELTAATGRTSLGLGSASTLDSTAFLAAGAKAADSDLLDGHDTAYFQVAGSYLTTVAHGAGMTGSGTVGSPLQVDASVYVKSATSPLYVTSGNMTLDTTSLGVVKTATAPLYITGTNATIDLTAYVPKSTTVNGQQLSGNITVTANLPSDPTACGANNYVYDIAADGTLSCRADQTGGDGSISGLTSNWVVKSTGTNTVADSSIYDIGGNIGIGTTNPLVKFSIGVGNPSWTAAVKDNNDAFIKGDLEIDGALYVDGFLYGNGSKLTGISGSGTTISGLTANNVSKANASGNNIIDSAIYSVDGNVGIGTATPRALFLVADSDIGPSSQIVGYTGANTTVEAIGNLGGSVYQCAQTFVLASTTTITSVTFQLGANNGSPTETITVRIETTSGGAPTGTLAHANLTVAVTPIASSVNTATFSAATLAAGTYAIIKSSTSAQSSGNYWNSNIKNGDPYASGAHYYKVDAGAWTVLTGYDEYFAVLGMEPGIDATPFAINSNGDVGIGTVAPVAGLQLGAGAPGWSAITAQSDAYVTGDVEIDGALYVDGFLYGNGSKLTGITGSGTVTNVNVRALSGNPGLVVGSATTTTTPVIDLNVDNAVYQNKLNGTGLVRMTGETVAYDATIYEPKLSGTGYVKAVGSVISYDSTVFQPQDGDLSSIAALSGTVGHLRKTEANTFDLDTTVYGTVTNVTVNGNNGLTVSSATTTTTPVFILGLGAISPSSLTVGGTSTINNVGIGTASITNTLTVTGNVGIGTTAPIAKLEVDGNLYVFGGNIGIGTWSPASNLQVAGTGTTMLNFGTAAGSNPCGTWAEGSLFWTTGHVLCNCDNAGAALKVGSATTCSF